MPSLDVQASVSFMRIQELWKTTNIIPPPKRVAKLGFSEICVSIYAQKLFQDLRISRMYPEKLDHNWALRDKAL